MGPLSPLQDHSVDVVISMLSFRYLDWDPIMKEIERVLKKDGKFIVVDMVTAPVKWKEIPQFSSRQDERVRKTGFRILRGMQACAGSLRILRGPRC